MTITNPLGRMRMRSSEPTVGPPLVLAGALAAVLTVGAVFRHAMSDDALLPGRSVAFFIVAAAVALIPGPGLLPGGPLSSAHPSRFLPLSGFCIAYPASPGPRWRGRARTARAGAAPRGWQIVLAPGMAGEGSGDSGAGARMIVTDAATPIGAVSGGCLEADIVARAPDVTTNGVAELVRYDTRASDDVVLGLGIGVPTLVDGPVGPRPGGRAMCKTIRAHGRRMAGSRWKFRSEIGADRGSAGKNLRASG